MSPAPLHDRLVLHRFLMSELGAESFEQLAVVLRDPELELVESDGTSRFHHALIAHRTDASRVDSATLLEYDQAIGVHTRTISERRGEPIRWRYFQYLMLLVTERYLDRLFRDRLQLLGDLSVYLDGFNTSLAVNDKVPEFTEDDLRKLAFWSATGSGKTLLMHVNLLQYRRYLERHERSNELNRVILLTPNEGLSHQHLAELRRSGIEAEIFGKDQMGLWAGRSVEIIDIHKLREQEGVKSVAVDAFERNNLVLVDEGHRGAGGDVWMDVRDRLSAEGFSFEYSATFGQAFAGEAALSARYAKWILFDYSYGRFHADGYGKDYRILNLPGDGDAEARHEYLSAAILSFYQQRRLYSDKQNALRPFRIETPLWIFVGSSVQAKVVRQEGGQSVSDVLEILLTFARCLARPDETAEAFERLLTGTAGLYDGQGNDVFSGAFPYLDELGIDGETAYSAVLRSVFNAEAPGLLRVVLLRGVDGEIALQVGDNPPFGVVNVGDAPRLHRLCVEHSELIADEYEASESLFRRIEDDESSITVLIGAKKFIEGWSSWRVSSLGLMRVGQGEGSQIIQLFGRGVRLKGMNMMLRRSARIEPPPSDLPKHIGLLETLTVFGVKADYMTTFRDQLAREGVGVQAVAELDIPVTVSDPWPDHLRIVRLPAEMDFRQSERSALRGREGEKPPAVVQVDWYPRVQAAMSGGAIQSEEATKNVQPLTADHVAFIDRDRIFHELVRFKRERGWANLEISRDAVDDLLGRTDWYELRIPPDRLARDRFERVREWEEIALALLKGWCERLYKADRAGWESDRLEYRALGRDDPNVISEHRVTLDAESALADELRVLRERVEGGNFDAGRVEKLKAVDFDRHLYRPLLSVGKGSELRVRPAPLNEGEARFVDDLRDWASSERDGVLADRELYVLRNLSRGRGVGFFEGGNFYPDFIVWLVEADVQRVIFVDPKGLVHLYGIDHPKIQFRHKIKELERRLDEPSVRLSSFILSVTRFTDLTQWHNVTKDALQDEHVLFQLDDSLSYIGDMFRLALADDGSQAA